LSLWILLLDSLIDLGNLFSKKNTKNNENIRLHTTSKIERATKLVQTGAKVVVILDTIVEK
jgi:hypothetical protein